MPRIAVLNVVGLTPALLARMPRLAGFAANGNPVPIESLLPAVTCPVQATYLTGRLPHEHGIVGNGWYFRDECEVRFWRQSNKLVQAPKLWELARERDPAFTCANLFWWFNMYSGADVSVTPRPCYPADGRKIPDLHTRPADLRAELQRRFGRFPLFDFWGPKASIRSSRWIAEVAQYVDRVHRPSLSLVYLPHLDYDLQRFGPNDPAVAPALRAVDEICGELVDHYESGGTRVIVLSEYGITPVSRPVHLNRVLRAHGLLAVREELGRELLDAGASAAFAVADHQAAHVYVNEARRLGQVREILEQTRGVERVLGAAGKVAAGLDHPRAGDLVCIAEPDAWFTYYYWLDDGCAPDFARTVDIHRKPGYDPAELFLDPALLLPRTRIAWKLLRKTLGFRALLDVIPLDAGLVRGSHGRAADAAETGPLFIAPGARLRAGPLRATDVCGLLLRLCLGDARRDRSGARRAGDGIRKGASPECA